MFDKVVAVSEEVREKILDAGVPLSKVQKIKNGVSIEKYGNHRNRNKIRTSLGIGPNETVIGSVSRLDRNKGLSFLLRAAQLLAEEFGNIRVLIVGSGPSIQELQDEAAALGIGRDVIFTGYRDDISEILSAIDIYVLPSLKEGLPMILLEAMASKRPVIATSVGDIPTAITHNESGFLVNPGDENQLRDAIRRLLTDGYLASQMAEQAFKKVNEEYSSKIMAKHYRDIYRQLLKSKEILNDI